MKSRNQILQKTTEFLGIDNPDVFLLTSLRVILLIPCIAVPHLFVSLFLPGILFPKIALNKYYWVFISSVFFVYYVVFNLNNLIANHVHVYAFLLILGMLTVLIHNISKDWKSFFGTSAKWLIGLVFLLATIGKFLAPEFFEGSFFEMIFYTDKRFNGLSTVLLGSDSGIVAENLQTLDFLIATDNPETADFVFKSSPLIDGISLYMAYWTILIEGLIAVLFLLPERFRISKARDFVLLLFVITTYPIATVPGFAMSLLLLAFVQSYLKNGSSNFYTLFYLLLFLFISVFAFPFSSVLKYFF